MTNTPAKVHDGAVVSVVSDTRTSICSNGKTHHTSAKDAGVTCAGKACALADLKTGTLIRITTTSRTKAW